MAWNAAAMDIGHEQIDERLTVVRSLNVCAVFLEHVGSWDLPQQLVESVGECVLPVPRAG